MFNCIQLTIGNDEDDDDKWETTVRTYMCVCIIVFRPKWMIPNGSVETVYSITWLGCYVSLPDNPLFICIAAVPFSQVQTIPFLNLQVTNVN